MQRIPPIILPQFFGDSAASATLAKMLTESKDAKLISKLSRHWNQYTAGLNDIMPCQNSTQVILLEMWTERFVKSGQEVFGDLLEAHAIPYSYYVNVAYARLSRAKDMGAIWQKMES